MASSTCQNPLRQQIKQQAGKSIGRKIIHQIKQSPEVLTDCVTFVVTCMLHGLQQIVFGAVPRSLRCPRSGSPSGSPRSTGHALMGMFQFSGLCHSEHCTLQLNKLSVNDVQQLDIISYMNSDISSMTSDELLMCFLLTASGLKSTVYLDQSSE